MAVRIWNEDPHLTVLRRLVVEARTAYDALVAFEDRPEESLMKHKFTVEWLIQEIQDTVRNYDKWSRGRHKLTRLLDVKYQLIDYLTKTLEFPYEESVRLFNLNHEDFKRHLTTLNRLWGP